MDDDHFAPITIKFQEPLESEQIDALFKKMAEDKKWGIIYSITKQTTLGPDLEKRCDLVKSRGTINTNKKEGYFSFELAIEYFDNQTRYDRIFLSGLIATGLEDLTEANEKIVRGIRNYVFNHFGWKND